jgi:imidazolonepropionase-like amidohydrolase
MKTMVLKNTTLIDGTGREPVPNSSVIIEGDRIKEVLSGSPEMLPADAVVIDCHGQTLLPGLIDAHIHIGAVESNLSEQQRRFFPSMLVIKALKIMEETLDQGFTTARDAGGADPGFREAVTQGLVPGPRLFVPGRMLSQTGGHGDLRLPTEAGAPTEHIAGFATRICDGVDEVRRAAREQLRQGVDHIKVMASGGAGTPSDEAESSQYSLEELRAIVFEAESVGKYVMAHIYPPRSIKLALEAGIRSIEHGNLLDQESAEAIRDAGAYLVPTLVTYEKLSEMAKEENLPDYFTRKINMLREYGLEALGIAYKAGVKICSGSDLLGTMQRYKGMELELKSRVLGPMGAIMATTKTNAELLFMENDLGTVEAGKLADLIVVNGDVLKDIKLFQEYQEKITLIIQGGRVHKNIL